MKLKINSVFTVDVEDYPRMHILESKGIFNSIDSNFKKWGFDQLDAGEKIKKLEITQFVAEESSDNEISLPYIYTETNPLESDTYVFSQDHINFICEKNRDLLVGDCKLTIFFSMQGYETFAVEVWSYINNGKAQLNVFPKRLGHSAIITIPKGGLQVFVITGFVLAE